jgi:hypothetical protein
VSLYSRGKRFIISTQIGRCRKRSVAPGTLVLRYSYHLTFPAHVTQVVAYHKHLIDSGLADGKLGVTWSNLTVKGKGASSVFHENVLSQFNAPQQLKEFRQARSLERTIIDNSFGCVRPGEMLLVLARPGGGATTLLRLLSNQRKGYTSIEGDVRFGTLSPKEIRGFRGQVVMNGEEVSTKPQSRGKGLIGELFSQELFQA